jgi:hypothetical protein
VPSAPWCFVDDIGHAPDDEAGLGVAPASGLQNVDWLLVESDPPRAIRHRAVIVLQLLLMTAVRGVCHSEEFTAAPPARPRASSSRSRNRLPVATGFRRSGTVPNRQMESST